jgi:hypothetical protein
MEVNREPLFHSRVNSLGIDMHQVLWDYIQTSCEYTSKFGRTFDQMMCEFLNPFKGKSEYEELVDYYQSLEDSREEEFEKYLILQQKQNSTSESKETELNYDSGSDNYQTESESESDDDDGYWVEN